MVWLDENVDEASAYCQDALKQLQDVVGCVILLQTLPTCIRFLKEAHLEKVIILTSVSFGRQLATQTILMRQLEAIYILCENPSEQESSMKMWLKVKGIHNNIQAIC